MTIRKPADFASGIVLLGLMGILYQQSLSIDTSLVIAKGPLFFPYFLMGSIAFLSFILCLKSLSFEKSCQPGESATKPRREGLLLQAVTVVLLLAYLILLPLTGYIGTTILFLLALMLFLGGLSWRKALVSGLVAVLVTGFLYIIFAKVLRLFLP